MPEQQKVDDITDSTSITITKDSQGREIINSIRKRARGGDRDNRSG